MVDLLIVIQTLTETKYEPDLYICLYLSRFNDSVSYLYVGGGSMISRTALGTSLALPLFHMDSPYGKRLTGFQILILLAVRKCMKEQYEKEN